MKTHWQAAMLLLLGCLLAVADEKPAFDWKPPVIDSGVITRDLGMLDSEREEFATNLAIHATNRVVDAKADAASLEQARRMLALAQHLSPRNKRALVASFQLSKGIMPEVVPSNYSPQAFSRLLLTRGQLLENQGGTENSLMARLFMAMAAEMDPSNEDAVYASELRRIDHGPVDWKSITDAEAKKP